MKSFPVEARFNMINQPKMSGNRFSDKVNSLRNVFIDKNDG